ncbi:tail assembly chaperone [Salmonella enterica]|uniref:Tail assembly chaperone n=1 Tax=Salmonella enterica TaxID=28901 RepID=A0A5T7UMT2_SALER|nr:tail assembly chaperone [Salmonella enterica]EBZ3148632.1 tail assembly chaperone [Salmonella enterica subsp. enterica serovar Pomona]EBN2028980.1 tail assembly chaperone [Salmonella enterica]EGI1922862.1 tail assembly chaperone [Salmonella enterica]EGL6684798.1 tail assembly chaperone [Salmonella enterica]
MNNYVWSALHVSFFPKAMLQDYESAGWNLSDAIDVVDSLFQTYRAMPPDGKMLGVVDGMPAWIDKPPVPNSVLLSDELARLASEYKNDRAQLNDAYVAAMVSDGPSEQTKQQAVRDQITQRKAQYTADIAAAKLQYPV